jgi:hypothetical protein
MLLQVTADIFSGRENPSWTLGEFQASEVLRKLAQQREAIAGLETGWQDLGYRGLVLSILDDSSAARYDLPVDFRLAGGGSHNESAALEIAEGLVAQMPVDEGASVTESSMSAGVRDWVAEQMSAPPYAADPEASSGPLQAREEPEAHEGPPDESAAAAACQFWATAFNPGFWNNDPYVRSWNNCYNYAVNRRTNTFAQPGRASGYTAAMACNSVAQGASLDGARWWGNCFPPGTGGIWVMALVVAPGFDYHWYRYSAEGFWGHKPGGTAAKNTDNSGAIVYSPYYSARSPYTNFCGYLQCSYGMRIT